MNISTRSLGIRRKNSEMSEETCQKIVEAAENVFCEKGVCNSTIEDIALMAGMTRGPYIGIFVIRMKFCLRY